MLPDGAVIGTQSELRVCMWHHIVLLQAKDAVSTAPFHENSTSSHQRPFQRCAYC
jgi:hypothetical protein